jgi:hypothetical protein
MFVVLLALLTLPCIVLAGVSIFYMIGGIRTARMGARENNRAKKITGMNSVFASLLGMIAVFFVWMYLCRIFLSWEL